MDKLDERIKNSKEVIKESQISNPDDIYQKVKNKESKKAASKFIVNYNFVLRHALILLLMLAFYLSLDEILSVGVVAFSIAGIVALLLLLLFHKNGKERIAFVPFLCVGYVLCQFVG